MKLEFMIISTIFSSPLTAIAWIVAILVAIAIHEFAHAYAAYKLGDYTAKDEGRLTLNPIKHLDLFGTIMLFLVGFGWGKPVPVNYYNLRKPRWGPAIVSFAGPLSNIILALIMGLVLKILYEFGGVGPTRPVFVLISATIFINITLAVFNLIPIPPLDGSKILFAALPEKFSRFKQQLQRYGFIILIFIVFFAGGILSYVFAFIIFGIEKLFGFPPGIFSAAFL